jgi:hypothetical protein
MRHACLCSPGSYGALAADGINLLLECQKKHLAV